MSCSYSQKGNASRMPSDVEDKLKAKYDDCSQLDLIKSLECIKDRALELKKNMSELNNLCKEIPSMISSATRSLQFEC